MNISYVQGLNCNTISTTDPGKRLELFKKTEEANKVHGVQPIQKKKEKQRIDYFTGNATLELTSENV